MNSFRPNRLHKRENVLVFAEAFLLTSSHLETWVIRRFQVFFFSCQCWKNVSILFISSCGCG